MTIWLGENNLPVVQEALHQFEQQKQILLPAAYKQLLMQQNGGYIYKNHLPTIEPTSYGFNFLEVYRFLGINELITSTPFADENPLTGKKIFFHRDGMRYLGFDYIRLEPEIIYADFETMQTFTAAKDFNHFLNELYFKPFDLTSINGYSVDKLTQIMRQSTVAEQKLLFIKLEDFADKNWYFDELLRFLQVADSLIVAELFENQLFFFRRKLTDKLVYKLLNALHQAGLPQEKITVLKKEWEES
ncbi:SMI1/KNR4 family protein [Listeria sp. PSOL-1]|uniref:SMI1/KNR4 family protein n=1 Tax=Listeria sp. PSOL-1 TaxID=1844999 RepID=UPI0013CFE101|nr:SMI1/KNR4 family protein [Listeria sp. PSOL-1]